MFESHRCFGKGDEYNMAPALFVTQLKVCDTKNVHCTVDFFNVGGLIVSIVIFDISQKIYCYILHTFHGKSLLHRNPFTQHIFAPKPFYTTKFSHKKKNNFPQFTQRCFYTRYPLNKKIKHLLPPKAFTACKHRSSQAGNFKSSVPHALYCKKIVPESPKMGSPIFFFSA